MNKIKPIEPVQKKILAEEIADHLRTRIFDGTFKPGEKLPPERELARQLKVNRSSLREGLKILQQLGLVAIRHGDGTRVLDFLQTASIEVVKYLLTDRSIDRYKLMADIMEVRKLICTQIIKLAAKNIARKDIEEIRRKLVQMRKAQCNESMTVFQDFEFYEALAREAGNIILTMMLNTVKPPFKFFRPVFSKLVASTEEVWKTQERILDAIEKGDGESAVSIADGYLAKSAEHFIERLRKEKENEKNQDR